MKKIIFFLIFPVLFFTLLSEARNGSNTRPDKGVQAGIGNVCGVGRSKSEAQTNMANELNYPFILVQTDYSAYTGSEYTGRYLLGPFRAISGVVFDRVSIIADYNWTACIMVQGTLPKQ